MIADAVLNGMLEKGLIKNHIVKLVYLYWKICICSGYERTIKKPLSTENI